MTTEVIDFMENILQFMFWQHLSLCSEGKSVSHSVPFSAGTSYRLHGSQKTECTEFLVLKMRRHFVGIWLLSI